VTVRTHCYAAVLGLGLAGCGRQELDLLQRAQQDDPCQAFISQTECQANAGLGCWFQPNAEGCLSTDPRCLPGMCRGGDPFVRRVERSFFLHGAPFRFVGVSSWALLEATQCTSTTPENREAWMQRAYDELVPSRAKVARLFAFQSSAGPTGDDFTLFDSSVRYARRAGVRVVFVLDHAEGSCSQGGRRDAGWYGGGYRSPDGNYALSYRDFAQTLATRYRYEPTVLGYVLVHNMRAADAATSTGFVNDVGQLLEGIAASQLLSLDLSWDAADGGATYRALQQLSSVDLVDVDDYNFDETVQPLDANLLATLAQIDKPAVIGEGAFLLTGNDDAALQKRSQKASRRMAEWRQWGFSGALLWAYQPGWGDVSEEFDARPADPMLQPGGVVANAPW
jgi:mannan endo-1,4-beta-mannosidase